MQGFLEWLRSKGYRTARRILISIAGGTVVLIGIVLLVTPGPAFIVIPAGIAILALEFTWARRTLDELKRRIARARGLPEKPREEA